MKKQTNGLEDLASQIEHRKTVYVEKDPGFAEAQGQLEEFKLKVVKTQERIGKMRKDISEKEREIGDQVLAGGSSAVASLSQLRQKLVEVEDEGRIFKSVVEQAEASLVTIKEKVTKQFSITNVHLLSNALADLCLELEPAVEKIQALHTACSLPYLSSRDWSVSSHVVLRELSELEKIIRELQDRRELMRQMVTEVERT